MIPEFPLKSDSSPNLPNPPDFTGQGRADGNSKHLEDTSSVATEHLFAAC